MDMFEKAVSETPADFFENLLEDVQQCERGVFNNSATCSKKSVASTSRGSRRLRLRRIFARRWRRSARSSSGFQDTPMPSEGESDEGRRRRLVGRRRRFGRGHRGRHGRHCRLGANSRRGVSRVVAGCRFFQADRTPFARLLRSGTGRPMGPHGAAGVAPGTGFRRGGPRRPVQTAGNQAPRDGAVRVTFDARRVVAAGRWRTTFCGGFPPWADNNGLSPAGAGEVAGNTGSAKSRPATLNIGR